jgi:hypothetical protein
MWLAITWPAWELLLGYFRAELVDGTKTKFALHGLLYIFY